MSTIFAFVKLFECKEYAEDFLKGKLFMNTIRSFKEYKDENGELSGDEYEGIIALYQPEKLREVKIGEVTIPASDHAAPIVIHGEDLLDHNVFCIYSLNSRGYSSVSTETLSDFKRTIELNKSCFGLGKFCVVFLNASKFIDRCRAAILEKTLPVILDWSTILMSISITDIWQKIILAFKNEVFSLISVSTE
ncbi:hypothetical protein [Dickeya sp. NCPPB 3274]|uniref:hypothetical protein n=1 Tax=Dickeya sp. NCPPB 3274 TaxID=568766 RepID=UPI0005B52EE7|nr:hypothetical protein [Dickeya sp. NCPPB 3274]